MKKLKYIRIALYMGVLASMSACENYLDIVPKGQKAPESFIDYERFLANDYIQGATFYYTDLVALTNETYFYSYQLNTASVDAANYNWDETVNRVDLASNTTPYNGCYNAIFTFNLIVEEVGKAKDGTPQQKQQLIAKAKVLRAMTYFYMVNRFATPYKDEATAATTPAIAINPGISMEVPMTQASLLDVYRCMEADLLDAIKIGLPKEVPYGYHPKAGAAHAMLARIYLFQKRFDDALKYAELALEQNSYLDDWCKLYEDNKAAILSPWGSYDLEFVPDTKENYVFRTLSVYGDLTEARAAEFEPDDARLLCRYRREQSWQGNFYVYTSITPMEENPGGSIRTPEMYYIKAECLARKGQLQEALDVLNTVRVKRILPSKYAPWTLSAGMNLKAVIDLIRQERKNEYVLQGMEYLDMRRFNTEPEYQRTLTGVNSQGKPKQLTSTSHLWIQPFPKASLVLNPAIKQNTK